MSIHLSLVSALAEELNITLSGGKVDKVTQPSGELLILTIRGKKGTNRLLLSASSAYARIHITTAEYENPQEPPMFCMLLRKHLLGTVIQTIEQPVNDRIVRISLSGADDLGRKSAKKLFIEMIPGKINIILVDSEGIIIDCIHRRDYEPDMYRRVFPGMIYRLPQQGSGFIPANTSKSVEKELFVSENYPSVSAFLDDYYSEKEKRDLIRRKTKELRTSLISARKRIEKKAAIQKTELLAAADREKIRHEADLITANIYRIKNGSSVLVCEDFYSEGSPECEISLDPFKSPQVNAAVRYKEYNKLKSAEEYLVGLIDKAEQQLDYIDSALYELQYVSSSAEIDGVREELAQSGIIRSRFSKNPSQRNISSKPKNAAKKRTMLDYIHITTKNGLEILAGKNNLQNDELTFRIASKSDLWFHVKNYHGSHVILRTLGAKPEPEDIQKAAETAVLYSQASAIKTEGSGGKVPVDYTEIRFVKKRTGAYPGNVNYSNQTTILA